MTKLYESDDGDSTSDDEIPNTTIVKEEDFITPIRIKRPLECPPPPIKKRSTDADRLHSEQISTEYILDDDYDDEFFCIRNDSNIITPSLPIGSLYLKAVTQEEYNDLDLPNQFCKKQWVCIGKGLYLKRTKVKHMKLFK